MSEYEALRSDLAGLGEAMNLYAGSVNRHTQLTDEQVGRIWDDIGELRDEIHAVANRLETLTRAVMADPAEVAQAIVNDANRSTLRALDDDGQTMTCPSCNGHGALNILEADGVTVTRAKCEECDGFGRVVSYRARGESA